MFFRRGRLGWVKHNAHTAGGSKGSRNLAHTQTPTLTHAHARPAPSLTERSLRHEPTLLSERLRPFLWERACFAHARACSRPSKHACMLGSHTEGGRRNRGEEKTALAHTRKTLPAHTPPRSGSASGGRMRGPPPQPLGRAPSALTLRPRPPGPWGLSGCRGQGCAWRGRCSGGRPRAPGVCVYVCV